MDKLKVLMVSSEAAPFVKVGGLADVAGSLPKALEKLDVDVRLVIPKYESIKFKDEPVRPIEPYLVPVKHHWEESIVYQASLPGSSVPVYFIENAQYFHRDAIYGSPDDFERFIFFSRAALELCKKLNFIPDIIHCNDWHTALIPTWLKTLYKKDPELLNLPSVLTIHNLAYQARSSRYMLEFANLDVFDGVVPQISEDLKDNSFDILWEGLSFADTISTVSPSYAKEILTTQYGEGLQVLLGQRKDRLFGILNGIDIDFYNPETDKFIYQNFKLSTIDKKQLNKTALQKETGLREDPNIPLIGIISRLTDQKGFDLLIQSLVELDKLDCQIVLLGTGEKHYEELFTQAQKNLPEKISVNLKFDIALAQKIYAGADLFLMPSRFEPCGLGQMICQRYGAVPIVRKTGGLADTVFEGDNGFVFEQYDWVQLVAAINRAITTYHDKDKFMKLQQACMNKDFSWDKSAGDYVAMYKETIEKSK